MGKVTNKKVVLKMCAVCVGGRSLLHYLGRFLHVGGPGRSGTPQKFELSWLHFVAFPPLFWLSFVKRRVYSVQYSQTHSCVYKLKYTPDAVRHNTFDQHLFTFFLSLFFYLAEKYLNSYTVDNPVMMDMNGIHHRPTPPAGSLPSQFGPIQASPSTSRISEEKDFDDLEGEGEVGDYEISPEIQAHNISTFLSSGSESGKKMKVQQLVSFKDMVVPEIIYECTSRLIELCGGLIQGVPLVFFYIVKVVMALFD